jgi:hypothetical protein
VSGTLVVNDCFRFTNLIFSIKTLDLCYWLLADINGDWKLPLPSKGILAHVRYFEVVAAIIQDYKLHHLL